MTYKNCDVGFTVYHQLLSSNVEKSEVVTRFIINRYMFTNIAHISNNGKLM